MSDAANSDLPIPAQTLTDLDNRRRLLATYASVTVATILIFAKLAAYFMTDSVTMLSSLLDSTIDLIASLVTMLSVATALQPPDHDHRFGHAKAEPLATLAQAAFILGSAVLLGYEALDRIYHPHAMQNQGVGYAVMAMALVMTLVLLAYQRHVIGRTGSMAIRADRLHYTGDLVLNVAVVLAFLVYQFTGATWLDPVFALAIGAGLSASAWRIARDALHVLMDRELSDTHRARIKTLIEAHPSVHGMHDLRTRTDSDRVFVTFHIELDAAMTVGASQTVVDEIVTRVCAEFPGADITVHQDPIGHKEVRLDQQIERHSAG